LGTKKGPVRGKAAKGPNPPQGKTRELILIPLGVMVTIHQEGAAWKRTPFLYLEEGEKKKKGNCNPP